ncbi:hypothetical protein HBI04_046060 [Parastagonospora nodorum]|nr:hypothetical protein HBI10_097000 [Parastagonospora nodorum]KAH4032201.1 hypothetical protein HBI13_021450 [Parastagonospora nodorum]KAH4039439.1 hypothetical protein HBI09_031970 [Parastagonospora nodorum]KAH4255680.1 hypothetical protein HBI03_170260 [Parastagonospora nodorum]KAH4280609.1 hypothetical protein HBI04_046060 [Parastagonospora nodorum]
MSRLRGGVVGFNYRSNRFVERQQKRNAGKSSFKPINGVTGHDIAPEVPNKVSLVLLRTMPRDSPLQVATTEENHFH